MAMLTDIKVRKDGILCMAGLSVESPGVSLETEFPPVSARTANGISIEARPYSVGNNVEVSGYVLSKHTSLTSHLSCVKQQSWIYNAPISQIAAFDTGFVILHSNGTVSTLGDPRFEDCLGREVSGTL